MLSLEWRDVELTGQTVHLRSENSKNEDGRELFSLMLSCVLVTRTSALTNRA
jgi:hypothetical protein